MNLTRFLCMCLLGGVTLSFAVAQTPSTSIDSAFQRFWGTRSPEEAGQVVSSIVKTGVSFDEASRRLKAGRTYGPQQTGVIKLSNRTNGVEHWFSVNVPAGYSPARRYQVRFQLHGGVNGRDTNQPRGTGEIGNLAGAEQFYVLPYSWTESPWWGDDQVMNLEAIVDALKRNYNIDENRVALSGVSDGATGAYFIAMRSTTPYASILPLNGFIMVLSNGDIDDDQIFPNNLRNKPLFVINGGKDRLYPTAAVEPYTNFLKANGVSIDYHPQPNGEHNTAWWPEMKDTYEKFVADHPRDPHPDTLTWEATTVAHGRAHWLVIDQFGAQPDDSKSMADINVRGFRQLFSRNRQNGRVDIVRKGNTVEATTRGVSAFTLLLSPDEFDFTKPVKVVANGREVFNGRVEKNVETLLKWAARDNDRTMLYGAELKIRLSR